MVRASRCRCRLVDPKHQHAETYGGEGDACAHTHTLSYIYIYTRIYSLSCAYTLTHTHTKYTPHLKHSCNTLTTPHLEHTYTRLKCTFNTLRTCLKHTWITQVDGVPMMTGTVILITLRIYLGLDISHVSLILSADGVNVSTCVLTESQV